MTELAVQQTLLERLRGPWRILVKEIASFGVVGMVGFITDLTVFNVLFHEGELKAKVVATAAATTVTYFGNRYFSFSHRARSSLGREAGFFFGINFAVLIGSFFVLALFSYPLGYRGDTFVMNLVNLGTIALGTMFRFWSYKRFVFLHPDKVHSRDVDLDLELAE
jgi:putative flippase GtrA